METIEQPHTMNQHYNNSMYSNLGFQAASALQIRLDTDAVLVKIEDFLRGSRKVVEKDMESGQMVYKDVSFGKPLANEMGIQKIISFLHMVINPQTVQGNIEDEDARQIAKDVKIDLAYELMKNSEGWGILKEDRRYINRTIEKMCFLFLTRPIDNLERESFGMKTVEQSNTQNTMQSKGLFK